MSTFPPCLICSILSRSSQRTILTRQISRLESLQTPLQYGKKTYSSDGLTQHAKLSTLSRNTRAKSKSKTIARRRYERLDSINTSSDQILLNLQRRSGGPLFHQTALDHESQIEVPRSLGEVRPGDFVEVHTGTIITGVVLPIKNLGERIVGLRQFLVLTVSGELKVSKLTDLVLSFPSFVKDDLLEPAAVNIQSEEINSDSVNDLGNLIIDRIDIKAAKAMAEICKVLRALIYGMEVEKSKILPAFEKRYLPNNQNSDSSFTQITARDVTRQLMIDLGKSEEEANEEMDSPEKLYAAHQLLISSPDRFRMDPTSHRFTHKFSILSLLDRKAREIVRQEIESSLSRKGKEFLKEKDFPSESDIEKFSEKVKHVRAQRIGESSVYDAEGDPRNTSDRKMEEIVWTDSDKFVLLFLRSALGIRREFATESNQGLVFQILNRCGYEVKPKVATIDDGFGFFLQSIGTTKMLIARLFQDVGLLTPWDNLNNLENEFLSLTETAPPKPQHNLEEQMDEDEALRKDFHSIVYVIDDADAKELDDGISLERTDDPNQSWVHVHIADPTTFIRPDDEAALFAAKRGSTIYTPEATWPMLSKEYIKRIGLRTEEGSSSSRLAMTFSAKLDHKSGSALEYKVGLSRLHNVRIMTYSQATKMIRSRNANDKDTETLQTLTHLANICEKRRMDINGAFLVESTAKAEVKLSPLPLPISPIRSPSFANLSSKNFAGFPSINLDSNEFFKKDGPMDDSRFVIGEFANLACRIAARWMEENKIPALYRCQLPHGNSKEMNKLLDLKDSNGVISTGDIMKIGHQFNSAMLSPLPAQHFSLGIRTEVAFESSKTEKGKDDVLLTAGYVRATSPLRRFTDLMMHWQIRYAIRSKWNSQYEKNENIPFNYDYLKEKVSLITRKEAWIRSMQISSNHFWLGLKLHKAFLAKISKEKREKMIEYDQYAYLPLTEKDFQNDDEKFNKILDEEQDAMITLGDIRRLSNNELAVIVTLQSCDLQAECRWTREMEKPVLGEMMKVRIVDMFFQGSSGTILVERVN